MTKIIIGAGDAKSSPVEIDFDKIPVIDKSVTHSKRDLFLDPFKSVTRVAEEGCDERSSDEGLCITFEEFGQEGESAKYEIFKTESLNKEVILIACWPPCGEWFPLEYKKVN